MAIILPIQNYLFADSRKRLLIKRIEEREQHSATAKTIRITPQILILKSYW